MNVNLQLGLHGFMIRFHLTSADHFSGKPDATISFSHSTLPLLMNKTQTPQLLCMKQKSPTQNRQPNLLQLRTTASGTEDLIPATLYSNTTLCSVS